MQEFEELKEQGEDKAEHIETQVKKIWHITNDLQQSVISGSYDRWPFQGCDELHLMPYHNVKTTLTKLQNLDVTIKSQKEQGLASIKKILNITELITVSRNRRFPCDGEDYYLVGPDSWKSGTSYLHWLYSDLEIIDDDCVDLNYGHLKSINFHKCLEILDRGDWWSAYNNYIDMGDVPNSQMASEQIFVVPMLHVQY